MVVCQYFIGKHSIIGFSGSVSLITSSVGNLEMSRGLLSQRRARLRTALLTGHSRRADLKVHRHLGYRYITLKALIFRVLVEYYAAIRYKKIKKAIYKLCIPAKKNKKK